MKRRQFLTTMGSLAAVGSTAGALSSCSSGAGDSGAGALTIIEYQQTRADLLEKLIPEFQQAMSEQGEDIEVELVIDILTDGDFRTKVTQQFHSGTAPDIVDTGGSSVTGWATAGYLLPLDDHLADWPEWEDFYDASRQRAQLPDGHFYSVPHEASVQNLFVRRDVLDDLGIDSTQPETWDDLIDRLEQITGRTGEPSIVIPVGSAWGGGTWSEGFQPLIAGAEPEFYNPETETWRVESDGLSAAFDLIAKLVQKELLPVQDLRNPNPWEPTKYVAFPEGTLPVAAQGTWGWRYDWGPEGAAPIQNVQDKVITWNYPGLSAGDEPYSVSGGGFNFAVNAETEQAGPAMKFIQWLTEGEQLATQLAAVGAASPRPGIAEIEPYASDSALLDAEEKLQMSVVPAVGDGSDQISQAVQDATEQILSSGAGGQEAAETFARKARELLDSSLIAE